jgi:hypothetical protein
MMSRERDKALADEYFAASMAGKPLARSRASTVPSVPAPVR